MAYQFYANDLYPTTFDSQQAEDYVVDNIDSYELKFREYVENEFNDDLTEIIDNDGEAAYEAAVLKYMADTKVQIDFSVEYVNENSRDEEFERFWTV